MPRCDQLGLAQVVDVVVPGLSPPDLVPTRGVVYLSESLDRFGLGHGSTLPRSGLTLHRSGAGHHLGALDPGPPALAIPAFDVEAVGRMHVGVDLEDEEGTAPEAVDGGEDDSIAGLDCVVHGPSISFLD